MKTRTDTLTGAALDWAVATAEDGFLHGNALPRPRKYATGPEVDVPEGLQP